MTIAANLAAIWRKTAAFLEAYEQVGLEPSAEQRRKIASLEQRIAVLESAHHEG